MKLFMVLLGSKPKGRHVEQHDYFFGIADSIKALVPHMCAHWPEAGSGLHMDGWREVTHVHGHRISIVPKTTAVQEKQLFFINLGGYTAGKLEEQHYTVLSVQTGKDKAIQHAKQTLFFKTSAVPHVDDKYGIDVDDIFQIEDVLPVDMKAQYSIQITEASGLGEDVIQLGYFKLDKL